VTHQHKNSTLLQTVKNFQKYFQSETKQIKKYNRAEHKRRLGTQKGYMDNSHVDERKNCWIRNSPTDG
jgi:sugar lactone lactonase YvrE